MTIAKEKKEKEVVKTYPLGTPVRVVSASQGWGGVEGGDFGIIVGKSIEGTSVMYSLYLPRIGKGNWMCLEKDFEIEWGSVDSEIQDYLKKGEKEGQINEFLLSWCHLSRMSKQLVEERKREVNERIWQTERGLEYLRQAFQMYCQLQEKNVIFGDDYISSWRTLSIYTKYIFEVYEDVDIGADFILRAVTKPVVLRWRGIDIPMGTYIIVVEGTDVRITSKDARIVDHHYIHPHIEKSGKVCWGGWGGRISGSIGKFDYLGLLFNIADFLRSVDEGGWFVSAGFWLTEAENRCQKCWELLESCQCGRVPCIHCGLPIGDGCRCIMCPESGERIGKEYDPYCREKCEYWDKVEERCRGDSSEGMREEREEDEDE